jgi:hypothetical protein
MSCSTNASRSAGASVSSTTSNARPTDSASSASLGVDPVLAAHDRLGHVRAQGLLASRLARAQDVQAHPRDDGCQPSPKVLDAARVRAAEPEPGFPDGVVRLAQRAEHPVGDRPQVGPVGLESLRQPFVFVHRPHSLVAFRHGSDERNPADVTRETRHWHVYRSIRRGRCHTGSPGGSFDGSSVKCSSRSGL